VSKQNIWLFLDRDLFSPLVWAFTPQRLRVSGTINCLISGMLSLEASLDLCENIRNKTLRTVGVQLGVHLLNNPFNLTRVLGVDSPMHSALLNHGLNQNARHFSCLQLTAEKLFETLVAENGDSC